MAKLTKKQKFKKIERAVRYYGEVTVVFADLHNSDYIRRRKIDDRGHSFVSYFSHSINDWNDYSTSCFIADERRKNLGKTIRLMEKHDRACTLHPIEILVKGKVIKL